MDRPWSFQAECLRHIQDIPPAHLPRRSSAAARYTAEAEPFSVLLLRRQLQLYSALAAACPDSLPKGMVFGAGAAADALPRDWA
eukprot:183007-Pyramimonas_sp.AAC.1